MSDMLEPEVDASAEPVEVIDEIESETAIPEASTEPMPAAEVEEDAGDDKADEVKDEPEEKIESAAEEPVAAEAEAVEPAEKAETKPAASAEAAGGHPLQKIKSAEHSCVMIKGKLTAAAGKRYKYVFGQKATVTLKGYPVHLYAYAGITEKGGVEVLPIFLHVGDGDAPWRYIIKELAAFGLFDGFVISDYSDEIRKALAAVSPSTRHFSSITTPAASMPAITRANYDFTTYYKKVWQNTGGRVEDYEQLERLSGMCVDTLADFFKSKTYPV